MALKNNNLEQGLQTIRTIAKKVEKSGELHPLVYSAFYLLQAEYSAIKKNYEEFYQNALQYLAYTPEEVSIKNKLTIENNSCEKNTNFSRNGCSCPCVKKNL